MNQTPTSSDLTPPPIARRSARSRLARLALPVAVTALALSACNLEVDFDEEGVQQTFELDTIDAITIDAPFEVTIRQGDVQRVSVEVGESLVDDLVVEVVDGELRVDLDARSFSIGSDLIATITVTDLEALHASSASDVVVADLDVDNLVMEADEASRIRVSGEIDTLDLDMSQASDIELDGTTIDTVMLEMSGASSAEFSDTVAEIIGSIRGASSLDVANETNVRVDTSGASSIDRN